MYMQPDYVRMWHETTAKADGHNFRRFVLDNILAANPVDPVEETSRQMKIRPDKKRTRCKGYLDKD